MQKGTFTFSMQPRGKAVQTWMAACMWKSVVKVHQKRCWGGRGGGGVPNRIWCPVTLLPVSALPYSSFPPPEDSHRLAGDFEGVLWQPKYFLGCRLWLRVGQPVTCLCWVRGRERGGLRGKKGGGGRVAPCLEFRCGLREEEGGRRRQQLILFERSPPSPPLPPQPPAPAALYSGILL